MFSSLKRLARPAYRRLREARFKLANRGRERFRCPVCGYRGPFAELNASTGARANALCPRCGARERHRLQHLVMERVTGSLEPSRLAMLHLAPEPFFQTDFRRRFGRYVTADLVRRDVDLDADLCNLPIADASFDVVYASHILEHIEDDRRAIREIRRVLRPGGFAVLPVPMVSEATVEYPEANPHEVYHWRAPGRDYFDRYREVFARVDEYDSTMFDSAFQLYVYEDRSVYPTPEAPLRTPTPGERHVDVVPVCWR